MWRKKHLTFKTYCESVLSPINEDGKQYYEIVFLQGEKAEEPLTILRDKGEEAALDYLKEFDRGEEMDVNPEDAPWGDDDRVMEKDGYVMSWNTEFGYIGLVREVKADTPESPEPPAAPAEEPESPEDKEGELPL